MTATMLALVMFLAGALLLARVARGKGDAYDDLEDARRFIGQQIDRNIEALVQSYLEAGSGSHQPGPDRFAQAIEAFIGEVLLPSAGRGEPWRKEALREILILERESVYGEILARVRAHLGRLSPARL